MKNIVLPLEVLKEKAVNWSINHTPREPTGLADSLAKAGIQRVPAGYRFVPDDLVDWL